MTSPTPTTGSRSASTETEPPTAPRSQHGYHHRTEWSEIADGEVRQGDAGVAHLGLVEALHGHVDGEVADGDKHTADALWEIVVAVEEQRPIADVVDLLALHAK